jgi:hypothetical protein
MADTINNKINFEHSMAAHCENGVTSNLIKFQGIKLSEAMIFGIGSGIFFSYLPFIKLNGIPVISFRPLPGTIFKRTAKRLGFKVTAKKFKNKDKGMSELDNLLEKGIPVGMVVGVFHLDYFPPAYRFHFNAHNIVVYGKENNEYLISDPVMINPEKLNYERLKKVRYAKGTYSPGGKMYYISEKTAEHDVKKAVIKGIKHTCSDMLTIPIPLFGVKGIKYFSKKVKNWEKNLGTKKAALYMAQAVRMQEEIGTGGAGFRFLYAAFLQEISIIFNNSKLAELSKLMTETGDKWREFAILAGRVSKKRSEMEEPYLKASEILLEIFEMEKNIFTRLNSVVKEL